MRVIAAIAVVVILSWACSSTGPRAVTTRTTASLLSEDEKHRLYSAALATSDSPLDNATFKDVCQKIGIFDGRGQPNDRYMVFVGAHIEWAMKIETQQFKREINTAQNARAYLNEYLPR